MTYQEHRRCDKCKATYLYGTPHTCDHDSVDAARARLEEWLGEWTLESVT